MSNEMIQEINQKRRELLLTCQVGRNFSDNIFKKNLLGVLLILEMLERDAENNRISSDKLGAYLGSIPDNPKGALPFKLKKYPYKFSISKWFVRIGVALILVSLIALLFFRGNSLTVEVVELLSFVLGALMLSAAKLYQRLKKKPLNEPLSLACSVLPLTNSEMPKFREVLRRALDKNPDLVSTAPVSRGVNTHHLLLRRRGEAKRQLQQQDERDDLEQNDDNEQLISDARRSEDESPNSHKTGPGFFDYYSRDQRENSEGSEQAAGFSASSDSSAKIEMV